MAQTPPTKWYATSVGWTAVAAWATGTVKAVGALVRQNATPTVGNERVFVCIVAGTTHASTEPTWVVTKGGKTTDNTVTWQECTGQPGVNGDLTNTPLSSAQRSQSISLGLIILDNGGTHIFICTTAGTAGAGEPSYSTGAVGNTTVDSGATWTYLGTSFSAWAAPAAREANAVALNWAAPGDTIYVKSNHAETQATALTVDAGGISYSAAPISFVCVNSTSLPPASADVTTGAAVTTTGNTALFLRRNCYYEGVTFNCGTSTGAAALTVADLAVVGFMRFDSCTFNLVETGAASISFGSGLQSPVELNNVVIGLNSTQTIKIGGRVTWRDGSLTKLGSWSNNGVLFQPLGGSLFVENVDLSAFNPTGSPALVSNNNTLALKATFSRCKLASGVPGYVGGSASDGSVVDLVNCDTGGTVLNTARYCGVGQHTTDTNVVLSGGASDGTTGFSWNITMASGEKQTWARHFHAMPLDIWNPTTGANVTVTIEGLYNGAALPNNDEIWLEAVYFGTSSSPIGTRKSQGLATVMSANAALPSSSAAWTAAARQNSHAYVLGDAIQATGASSVVRVFICTTAGTSSGSLPVAYASAVDGGSVTDGTAVFRAGMRFQLTATLTSPQPQAAGVVRCEIEAAKQDAGTWWIDPRPVLS